MFAESAESLADLGLLTGAAEVSRRCEGDHSGKQRGDAYPEQHGPACVAASSGHGRDIDQCDCAVGTGYTGRVATHEAIALHARLVEHQACTIGS